jgi:hypothetical protein
MYQIIKIPLYLNSHLAQKDERRALNKKVGGSSPYQPSTLLFSNFFFGFIKTPTTTTNAL